MEEPSNTDLDEHQAGVSPHQAHAIDTQAGGANTMPDDTPAPVTDHPADDAIAPVATVVSSIELVDRSGLRRRRWQTTPGKETTSKLAWYITKVVLFKVFDGGASIVQSVVSVRHNDGSYLFDPKAPFRNFGLNGARTWLHMAECMAKLLDLSLNAPKITGMRRSSPRTATFLTVHKLFSTAATFGTGMGIAFQYGGRNVAGGIRHGYEVVDAISTALRLLIDGFGTCARMRSNIKLIALGLQGSKAAHQLFRVAASVSPSAARIDESMNTLAALVGGFNWTGHLINVFADRLFHHKALDVALDLHMRVNHDRTGYQCSTCGNNNCMQNDRALSVVNTLAFFSLSSRIATYDPNKRFGLPYISPDMSDAMAEPAGWEVVYTLLMDI